MREYEALIRRLDEVHEAFADTEGSAVYALDAAQRRRLRSRIELCLLDLQRQLSELILLDSDAEFTRRK
jgi:hypothetical protein